MDCLKLTFLILLLIPANILSKQEFYGDLRGNTNNIKINKIGDQTASNVAHATKIVHASSVDNIPNSLVIRDNDGNFTTNNIKLTGTATEDSHIVTKNYVDSSISNNLTLLNNLGSSPSVTKNYYVNKTGNDNNNGSIVAPFLTLKAAINAANAIASTTPVVIKVGSGIFIEDNSCGPIIITTNSVNIVGESVNGTIIKPLSLTQDLFNITVPIIEFANLTLDGGANGSNAKGVCLLTSEAGTSRFETILVTRFHVGISLNSNAGIPITIFNNTQFRGNDTSIEVNNIRALIKNSIYLGQFNNNIGNIGINITGNSSLVTVLTNSFRLMDIGIIATEGANLRVLGSNFENSNYGIKCNNASVSTIVGCNFLLNNIQSINCFSADNGTTTSITGCNFSCKDNFGISQGTAVKVNTGAKIHIGSCVIENAAIGLLCGAPSDTIATELLANSVSLSNNINDVTQFGSSTVRFIAGIANATKLNIENSTNVSFNSFDDIFTVGNGSDDRQVLFQIFNGQSILPNIIYHPNYYGNKGLVYQNDNTDQIVTATQAQSNHAYHYLVTGDNSKETGINLISDTTPFGNSSNVRGWAINKTGANADLTMSYSNDDTAGQAKRGANIVMQLNGLDNQIEFPITNNEPLPTNNTAKLIWGNDTNLYRKEAGILQTDGNLIANHISANLTGNVNGTITSDIINSSDSNQISFKTDNIERLKINNTDITTNARFVLLNVSCNQATQFAVPTNGGSIIANSNTSILILKNISNVIGYTINFPPNPIDGQFFMILLGTSNNVTGIINATIDGSNIVNGVSSLTPTDLIITDGGSSVSYFYSSSANSWYRCHRG